MERSSRRTWRGAVVIGGLALCTTPAAAQPFVGPTREYVITGCGLGEVGFDPVASRSIMGNVLCVQGTGTLGLTQVSGLTFAAFVYNLSFTRHPLVAATTFAGGGNGITLAYPGTGGQCAVGAICTLFAGNVSAPRVSGTPDPFTQLFFPDVPGSFDLASTVVTQAFIAYDYGIGPPIGPTSVRINLQVSAVPEPATAALVGAGVLTLGALSRRRTRAAV